MLRLAASFLVLSGIATLIYQVSWMRLLSLSVGSTSAAVSTVLAAFFMGMAAGSWLATRLGRSGVGGLKVYIVLEAIIGVAGIALLPVLMRLDHLMAALPALGDALWFKFVVTLVLLAIPTVCMGATFPVMAAVVVRARDELGLRLGHLYALNTTGAFLGAALAGFFLIPSYGLRGAVFTAAALNLIIAVAGSLALRRPGLSDPEEAMTAEEVSDGAVAPFRVQALTVLFFTGFVSIAAEVGWTKYLAIFTGTTLHGFSAILAVFLVGIALGSWLVKSHLARMRRPQLWMMGGVFLVGLSIHATRVGLGSTPAVLEAVVRAEPSLLVLLVSKYAFVLLLLLIPTLLFGALFPLSLKLYCGDARQLPERVGKAYAVNTLASIFGSILAGFWIIPRYGTDMLLAGLASAMLLLPLIFLGTIAPARRVVVALAIVVSVVAGTQLPRLDFRALIESTMVDGAVAGVPDAEFLFLREGKAGVVAVVTYDGRIARLATNGLFEGYFDMQDPDRLGPFEVLLGLTPYFLHPRPESAFAIGFGAGATVRALASTDLEEIRVVELEPVVVEAMRSVSGELPYLDDGRVDLTYNDARNTLLVEGRTYDIIVSQPSHPWLAGAGNLFTREFFEIVDSRLNPDGIFCSWISIRWMDATTLRSILQAFYGVFPEGFTLARLDPGEILLVGSTSPVAFRRDLLTARMNRPKTRALLSGIKIWKPGDLLSNFALSRNEALQLAGDVPTNRDDRILSETRLARRNAKFPPDEDPFDALRRNYSLDILPYLDPVGTAELLYEAAVYLLRMDMGYSAKLAAEKLEGMDPELERRLRNLIRRSRTGG